MQKIISRPHSPGDLVQVLSVCHAVLWQNYFAKLSNKNFLNCSLNSLITALVLEKNKFIGEVPDDPSDCQDMQAGIDIQQPEWVYTLLCNSMKIEALDIDIVACIPENRNGQTGSI